MSQFLERDRRAITVADVATALSVAVDVALRDDLPPSVRLEVSSGFGAWLEWLLDDELTHSRLLREFDAAALVGVADGAQWEQAGDLPSQLSDVGDVCSATKAAWCFVSARLLAEVGIRPLSHQRTWSRLGTAVTDAGGWQEACRLLRHLAVRWRMVAWLGQVFPLEELLCFGGGGHVPFLRRERGCGQGGGT